MNDKSTWCMTAAFSDEKGVLFLGQAIDCEAAPRSDSNFADNRLTGTDDRC